MDINTNEVYLNSALEEGIRPEAITTSITGVMDKSDEKGFVPKQFGKMMDLLISSKQSAQEIFDNSKLSSLVRNNVGRLDALIHDGLTPSEISMSFARQMTKNNQEDINFLTILFSRIKKKDLALKNVSDMEKQEQYQYQKVNTNSTL